MVTDHQMQEKPVRTKNIFEVHPRFILGDNIEILNTFEPDLIDCVLTSPPYWGKREYLEKGIGLEDTPDEYISNMLKVTSALYRALRPSGSFWLNIGDTYHKKSLLGIPWKLATEMQNSQGWIVRNAVIWNKHKGGMSATKDRLGNSYEYLFHFVKRSTYFYDADKIRSAPRQSSVRNGAVTTGTGVTGVRYKRQIELSTALTDEEKVSAFRALEEILSDVQNGKLSDFRMIIRNQQRTTHSESEKVSGRAKELATRGFYFLKHHPKGAMPADVWDIIPEDTQKRKLHYAPLPRGSLQNTHTLYLSRTRIRCVKNKYFHT